MFDGVAGGSKDQVATSSNKLGGYNKDTFKNYIQAFNSTAGNNLN